MAEFEYKRVDVDLECKKTYKLKFQYVFDELEKLGKDGWLLVSTLSNHGYCPDKFWIGVVVREKLDN